MDFDRAISLIESSQRILLTCHARPDGDAVGSLVALQRMILAAARESGRSCEVQILFLTNLPQNYQYLVEGKPWIYSQNLTEEQIKEDQLDEFDLIIVADTSAERQLPGLGEYLIERGEKARQTGQKQVLVLDHHLATDGIGSCRIINAQASAAGEIVYLMCRNAGWPLDEKTAEALLVAIGSDTGWFRFENSTPEAYKIAAELIGVGVKPDQIYQKLYLNDPPEKIRLLALTLETLELHCQGRLAVMQITRETLIKSGARREHIENIVNEPQRIGSVVAVILLVELDSGETRCSLRSKAAVDVNAVARQFDGGGHARAAGLTISEPPAQARGKIIDAMSAAIRKEFPS